MSRREYSAIAVLLLTVSCLCEGETPHSSAKPNPQSVTNVETSDSKVVVDISLKNDNGSDLSNASVPLKTDAGGVFQHLGLETGAVKRTFYVVAGLTGVVLLYFTVKGISTMRRRRRKPRRYGLLAEKEMKRFKDQDSDSDEGDEDSTLFDARKVKPGQSRKP